MYNHAENMTTVAAVDVDTPAVLDVSYRLETQPELSEALEDLAWQIALHTPEVMAEKIAKAARQQRVNLRRFPDGSFGISIDQ